MLRAEAENVLGTDLSGTTEDELLVLLEQAIHEKQVEFVHGSGKRKHPLQRLFESCLALCNKRHEYDES